MWDELLKLNPDNPEYLNNKSQALFNYAINREKNIGYKDDCNETHINSRIAGSFDREFNQLRNNNLIEKSFEILDDAINYNSEDHNFYFKKGMLYFHIGKLDEAIECFDKTIKLIPEKEYNINKRKAECYKYKGKSLENEGKHDEAIKYYDLAYNINPSYHYLVLKGNCYNSNSKFKEAIEYYDKAFEEIQRPTYLINKSIALIHMGLLEEALECMDKPLQFIQENDKNRYLLLKIGLLIRLNRFDEAKMHAEEKFGPSSMQSIFLDEIKYLDNAINCINEALKSDKDNVAFLNNKKIYLRQRSKRLMSFNYVLALDDVEELIELYPNYAPGWFYKGAILDNEKKFNQARECFIKALELLG